MVDNNKGLQELMDNVQDYIDDKIGLVECLDNHSKICFNKLDGHIDYFTDGWSKDLTLNLFKYVVRAVEGDRKAYERLRVDLGIDDCNLTIREI